MNTFLPYPDFKESARVLDDRRLGKQRLEALTILETLLGKPTKSGKTRTGWLVHPAVLMWKGYEEALKLYYNTMVREWIHRGFKNTMPILEIEQNKLVMPSWLGDPRIHSAYRSNLLRKDPKFYAQYGWEDPPNIRYLWPRTIARHDE